ncbi:MAG: hypothetical protein ABFC77_15650 [Thermoguttaceae bacterium]|jgi:hypothetical protein
MIRLALTIMLAGCGTTVNMHGGYPNLQTINLGQPGCVKDCTTTHTATQGDGATGATVTTEKTSSPTRSTNIGAPQ